MAKVVLIIIGGEASTSYGPDVEVVRLPVAHDSNAESLQQDHTAHAEKLREARELRAKELGVILEEHVPAKLKEDK